MTLDVIDRTMVEAALELLEDVQALGMCELASLDIVVAELARSGFRDTPLGRGTALKAILREMIEGMEHTSQGIATPHDAKGITRERYYTILWEQYFEHSDRTYIMETLFLSSDGYYSKLRRDALNFVANRLGEREQQHFQERITLAATVQVRLESAQLAPPQLPETPDPAYFVDRESEIEDYRRQIEREGLAVISGFPGVGKTALAAKLARQLVRADKILWYSCRLVNDVDSLIEAVAQFLAYHGHDGLWRTLRHAAEKYREPLSLSLRIDYVREHLLNKGYVVCLDDLHMIADDAQAMELVRRLVDTARQKRVRVILATRWLPNFLSAEGIRPLGGLRADDVRLLAAHKHVSLSDMQCRSLQDYTRGNPDLLLHLLGLLQKSPDPAMFLDNLPETARLEQFISREVDGGLNEQARAIMVALAILDGGPALPAAIAAVAGVSGAAPILVDLANRDLVVIEQDGYRLRRLLQTYYLDYPRDRERSVLHHRAAKHYEQSEPERDWLRASGHYVDAGRHERAARILAEHGEESISRGKVENAIKLLIRLEGAPLTPLLKVDLITLRAEARVRRGDGAGAQVDYEQALWRLGADTDPDRRERRARIYRGLGYLFRHRDPNQALHYIQLGLAAIASGESPERAALLIRQGHIQVQMGAYEEAQRSLEQGLALLPPSPSQLRGLAFLNLGNAYGFRGDRLNAVMYYRQALAVFEAAGDDWRLMDVLLGLGIEADLSGEWLKAAEYYEKALKMARNWGGVKEEAACELALGNLRSKQGRLERAEQHYTRSLTLARQHALNDHVVDALLGTAALHLRRSSPVAAASCLKEAEQISIVIGSKGHWPELGRSWALYYLATNEPEAAYEHAARAVETARQLDITPEVGLSLRVLGQTLQIRQQHQDALVCLSESYAILGRWNPYEAALTQVVWSRSLRALGRREEEQSLQVHAKRILQSLKLSLRDTNLIV